MTQLKNKKFLYLILLFSIFALIAAYFIEYVLGYIPCNLCIIERIPYIFTIIIILYCLLSKKFEKFFLIILSLIFFLASMISFYHFGIEQGFFKESLVCNLSKGYEITNPEELLRELQKKTISCADVSFKILGISLATLNTIISLILSVIIFRTYLNYEKNK